MKKIIIIISLSVLTAIDVEEELPAFSELFPNWSNPVEYARNESS